MNDQIRVPRVNLVSKSGEMVGEMATTEARQKAQEAGLDLVEVAPDARPPVCRIMDFGKSQYDRKKKQTTGQKTRRTQLKQVRLRAKTDNHDVDVKVRRAEGFLKRGDKVKINVLFRGRENAHHERGIEMLKGIIEALEEVASVEKSPGMESGRMMSMILAPKK